MAGILAGIDIEVIAIAFLFVVLVGVLIVRPLLVALFSQAPFIGGWLASNVDSGLASFERSIQPAANAALGALSQTIDWLASTWDQLVSTVSGLGDLTYTALWRIVHLKLPELEGRASGFASALVDQLRALLVSEVAQAERAASLGVAGARAEAVQLVSFAEAQAAHLAAANEALTRGLVAIAEQDAVALVQTERALVVDELGGVRSEIDRAFAAAMTALNSAEVALRGDVGAIERQLGAALSDDVNALLRQIAADKAALSAAFAGSLAGVVADIAAIRALKCIQNCSPLGDLGAFLNGLDAALLIGFVAYARAHPAEAVGFFRSEVTPFVKDLGSQAQQLV